jgi:hypothetical protein
MKVLAQDPPRTFRVGPQGAIELRDCGRVQLEPDEQVTFTTPTGAEYDVVAKSWGFYATPSVNGRLVTFGFSSALVKSADGKRFVLLVDRSRRGEFDAYLAANNLTVVVWLDDDRALDVLDRVAGQMR